MNSSFVCKEMLINDDTARIRSLIEQKSTEVDLSIKELKKLAEKLNIPHKPLT